MRVSREVAIKEIEQIRSLLTQWLKDLKEPRALQFSQKQGYVVVDTYDRDASDKLIIPPSIPVHDIDGIPVEQLRAELILCAHKLEALATS